MAAMHMPSVAPPPKSRSFRKPTKKGPKTCTKQVHAAIGDGHRLPPHAVGHCQLNGDEHNRENRSGDADGDAIHTHGDAGARCEGQCRKIGDLNEADATEQ